ncbi:MAG: hypothetical protein CMM55_15065 [Rhodospirillaceae bacterium]|nr:hypothetical protein [Rhodospirillaceae bacterium]
MSYQRFQGRNCFKADEYITADRAKPQDKANKKHWSEDGFTNLFGSEQYQKRWRKIPIGDGAKSSACLGSNRFKTEPLLVEQF